MRSCFDKNIRIIYYVFGLESKRRSSFPSNERSRQDECIRNVDERHESVEDSSSFFAREERSSTRKSQTFVATGSCLTLSLFGEKQKNDCAQHNKFGMSFVGQVVLDTEPLFFFSLGILFVFSARPRRFGEKKK